MTEDRSQATSAKRAGRAIPFRTLAIAAAIPVIGFAAMIGLRPPAGETPRFAVTESGPAPAGRAADPLAAELERCRTAAADTVADRCRAAWEVNRRRFLGESRRLILPAPEVPAAPAAQEGR